ncbi:MAG: folylpolyglutamate synthase/dihydrofolate synthase family protein [Candidatus Omnitrophota bacterium]
MNYQEAIQYLNSFIDHEKDNNYDYSQVKLERVESLLKKVGNPHEKLKCLHIAGTKGKGSTCAFIFSILKEAGYKVGLYTSPHLIDVKERIRISYRDEMNEIKERLILQNEITKLTEELKPEADLIKGLTFFEVYTVIAFLFFSQQNVDFVVLETGLGGRLDATNVVRPLVSGLSSISLDHTQILGNSLEKISREKVGIIKENGLAVSVPQAPQVWREVEKICKEKNVKLYEIGHDFICDSIGQNLNGSTFDFRGIFGTYQNLHTHLIGQFQLINAALALAMIQMLKFHDIVISSLAVKKGCEKVHWPGRMHVVHKNPYLVLDGAQNPDSAHALRSAIGMLFIPKKSILVFGVSRDKNVEGMIPYLARSQNSIILTQANHPRAMDVDTLAKKMSLFQRIIKKTKTVQEALLLAVKETTNKDDLILVTGSLYVVGEAFLALKTIRFPDYK